MITYKSMDYLLWKIWCKNCDKGISKVINKFLEELIEKYNVTNIDGNFYPEKKIFIFTFNFKYGNKKRKYGIKYYCENNICPHIYEDRRGV